MDVALLVQYGPAILSGLLMTVQVCVLAGILAVSLALPVSLAVSSPLWLLRVAARTYIEIMRGTPVLIVLFLLYYGGPSIGVRLDALPAGVLGLGCYGAAFFAEIFRAGFQSIPKGQIEAARMVGMTNLQIMRQIKVPQMLALILPPGTNQFIILVKESALLSIITVAELTKTATQMANETFAVVEPYLVIALLYWLFIEIIAQTAAKIEERIRWQG